MDLRLELVLREELSMDLCRVSGFRLIVLVGESSLLRVRRGIQVPSEDRVRWDGWRALGLDTMASLQLRRRLLVELSELR